MSRRDSPPPLAGPWLFNKPMVHTGTGAVRHRAGAALTRRSSQSGRGGGLGHSVNCSSQRALIEVCAKRKENAGTGRGREYVTHEV